MSDMFEKHGCLIITLMIIGILALIFIGPAITMLLWNWIAVDLFALPVIGYWQAFGLTWLCKILFGGVNFNSKADRD